MAQPQVLLFNLTGEKRRRIRFLLIKLGLGCVEVPAKDFGCTLGALSGREGFPKEPEAAEPFTGEMLVMDELNSAQFNAFIDGLHRVRCNVALKAIVTENNLQWTAARLYQELGAEHEALKATGKSVHSGQ